MDWQMGWSWVHHLDLPKDSTMVEQKETQKVRSMGWQKATHWGRLMDWHLDFRLVTTKARH